MISSPTSRSKRANLSLRVYNDLFELLDKKVAGFRFYFHDDRPLGDRIRSSLDSLYIDWND
uniref:Uncharacterized protein n=1 Tax=Romanomermis culicivorax TaxID=13658 RepID=A0A915L8L3_ROMCU